MKKLLYLLCLGALTFVACEKELSFVENNEPETVVLTFSSERPQLEPTTRTEWNSDAEAIFWSENDKIRVGYTLNGNWMGGNPTDKDEDPKFYKSEAVSIDGTNSSIGTFKVPMGNEQFINPSTSGDYQFFSIYPGDLRSSSTISNPDAVTVSLRTTQTPGVNTFDPSTDVMVGKSDVEALDGLSATDPITLKWVRLVGHVDLTFSNMAFVGTETVNKITLIFNDDAKVAGDFSIDIPNRTAGIGTDSSIILEGSNLSVSGTSVKAWASVLPATFTALDVEINTNKATYTRSISGLNKTFVRNRRNILTINMATAERTEVEQDNYVLYTGSVADITDGRYIIAAKVGNTYYGLPNTLPTGKNGSTITPLSVIVSDGYITSNPTPLVLTFTKNGNNYTIQGANGTLGHTTSTSLGTTASGNAALWTISTGTNGRFRITNVSTSTRALAFNGSIPNNSTTPTNKFGAYATSNITATGDYYDVELFKYTGSIDDEPSLSVSPATTATEPASWPSDNDETKTFTITPTNGTWSYSATNMSWATITRNGDVLIVKPNAKQASEAHSGTITITLTPNSSSYSSQTATIYLSQAKYTGGGTESKTATINFGNNGTKINQASVTGSDSEGNTWTVTTQGTTSFTPNTNYSQVGSSNKPATSITFTTTLASAATNISLDAKFGGYSGTAGTVNLKVGNNTIGTGSLNGTNDVTVSSTSTASGTVLTVTVTNISKGVKCYYIKATYTN